LEPTGETASDDTPPRAVLTTPLEGPSAAVAPGCPKVAAKSF